MAVLVLRFRRIVGHVTCVIYLCLQYLLFLGELAGPEQVPTVAALIAGIMTLSVVLWHENLCLKGSCGLLAVCAAFLCLIIGQPDTGRTELLVLQIAFAVFDLIAENTLLWDLRISQQHALPFTAVPISGYADTSLEDAG